MGEFWTALGIAPRPAFSLTVTIALQPYAETEQLPRRGRDPDRDRPARRARR